MTNIYINYNPYTVETEFKINNEPLRKDSRLAKQSRKRLQYWLEKNNNNWSGIVEELSKATNDNELNITFKGRKIDFEDLLLTVNKYKDEYKIKLNHIEAKNDSDILKEIDKVFKETKNGPVEELKSDDIKRAYEEAKSSKFKVSVIATMSSGKSTLINSFIGYELLPSENKACTATVARITDNDHAEEFTAECKDENEQIVYERKSVKLENIQRYNKDEKVTYIDIEGRIPNISSEKMNLLLMDTPGPNNSRNKEHGELTDTIINDKFKGIVMYVINATQFGINDDSKLITIISDAMKRGGKQSKDRFIFAINKCDEFDCEKEESIKYLLEEVTKYLTDYGIEEPNIFPVSAQTAKLIRMSKNDIELTRKEKKDLSIYEDFNDLEGYHFDKLAPLSEASRKNLEIKLFKAKEAKDVYEEALIHTGIPAIEEAINEYLEKYAYPIKIKQAVKEFSTIIEEKDMMAKIDEDLITNNEKYLEIRKQVEVVRKKRNTGEGAKQQIEEKIENFDIDDSLFEAIKREVFNTLEQITEQFANKKRVEKDTAEREITKFKNQVAKLEKDCEIELNRVIKNSVIDEGEKLVTEYQNYVCDLKDELNINGFNFEKVREFQKMNIEDVDELMGKYSTKEAIYKERINKNHHKKWYKPFTWFEPAYYTSKEKVGEKEMINLEPVIDVCMTGIMVRSENNINNARSEGKRQVKGLKGYFKLELDELDILIDKIVDDFDNKTRDKDQIEERVKKNKKTKLWLEYIINKIDGIMNM